MTASLFTLALFLCTQTPDGAGPAVQPPPSAVPAPAPQPDVTPVPPPAQSPAANAPAPTTNTTTAAKPDETAAKKDDAKKDDAKVKDKKDHLSGLFVGGVGVAVVCMGLILGVIAGSYSAVKGLPFPAGDTERASFITSALVGGIFMAVVGSAITAAGVALLAASFI